MSTFDKISELARAHWEKRYKNNQENLLEETGDVVAKVMNILQNEENKLFNTISEFKETSGWPQIESENPSILKWYPDVLLYTMYYFKDINDADNHIGQYGYGTPTAQFFGQFHALKVFFETYPEARERIQNKIVDHYSDQEIDMKGKISDYLNWDMESMYVTFLLQLEGMPDDFWKILSSISYNEIRRAIFWDML